MSALLVVYSTRHVHSVRLVVLSFLGVTPKVGGMRINTFEVIRTYIFIFLMAISCPLINHICPHTIKYYNIVKIGNFACLCIPCIWKETNVMELIYSLFYEKGPE